MLRICKLSVLDITLLVLSLNICNSSEVPNLIYSLYPKSNVLAVKANVVSPKSVIVACPKLPLDLNVDEVNVSIAFLTSKSKFWFVESHVTAIPDSVLFAIKSCAL